MRRQKDARALGYGLCLGTFLPTLLLPALAYADTINYAIVIGNNSAPATSGQEELGELRYADDDAARYYNLFSQLGEARLLTVLDSRSQRRFPGLANHAAAPTLENLRSLVREFEISMKADRARGDSPVLYFAFSGHGARDAEGNAFLALMDGSLTQDVLYDGILAKLPSSYTHLIVDACHAGGVIGVRGGFFDKEVEGETTSVGKEDLVPILESSRMRQFPHLGILLSASLGEEAHEWSEIESGVFTHEVLSGLLGAADINADQSVAYSEMRAFVASANRSVTDLRARPQIVARPPRANHGVTLMDTARISGGRVLSGDASNLGRFFIELPNGGRYLEAHLAAGTQTTLRLPEGEAFVRTAKREARVPAGRAALTFSELVWKPRTVASRGSIEDSYRRALFSSPYGRSYYQGWIDSTNGLSVGFAAPGNTDAWAQSAPADTGQRNVALGFVALAGVAGAFTLAESYFAFNAWRDWETSELQQPSDEAKARYERSRTLAVSGALLSAASGAAAWYLWPASRVKVAPASQGEGYALTLGGSW